MEKSRFAMFYITHESKAKAEEFVSSSMSNRWVACGNIFPIESSYMWRAKVVADAEYVSIVKTGLHLVEEYTTYAEKIHPYDTPCIIHWPVRANTKYVQWIYDNVKNKPNP